jgi:hypothetical protein
MATLMAGAKQASSLAGLAMTADELGDLAGITGRRVRDLCASAKVARGQYGAEAAIRILLERTATPEAAGLTEERTGLVRAQRLKAEMDYALAKGEIAPISEMKRAMDLRCALIRARMMALPARTLTMLIGETDEIRFREVMTTEVKLALTEAAAEELAPEMLDDDDIEPEEDTEE